MTAAEELREAATIGHVVLDEANGKADCTLCRTGVSAPPSFGSIPRTDMLAAFVVQHSVHTKAGVASGLTPSGRPSKAALAHFAALTPDAPRGGEE